VAGAGEVLPGVELADLRLANRRLAEVKAIEVARDGEVGEAQLALVGTRLAIGDLSCEQLPQPVGWRELLLAQRRPGSPPAHSPCRAGAGLSVVRSVGLASRFSIGGVRTVR